MTKPRARCQGQLPGSQGIHNPPLHPLPDQVYPNPSISPLVSQLIREFMPRTEGQVIVNERSCFCVSAHHVLDNDCARQSCTDPHKTL